jgi:hypothetical protein
MPCAPAPPRQAARTYRQSTDRESSGNARRQSYQKEKYMLFAATRHREYPIRTSGDDEKEKKQKGQTALRSRRERLFPKKITASACEVIQSSIPGTTYPAAACSCHRSHPHLGTRAVRHHHFLPTLVYVSTAVVATAPVAVINTAKNRSPTPAHATRFIQPRYDRLPSAEVPVRGRSPPSLDVFSNPAEFSRHINL